MSSLDLIIPKDERYGDNVVRTNRIISWILCKWSKAPAIAKESREYLKAIHFDKLGELVCRILDTLNQYSPDFTVEEFTAKDSLATLCKSLRNDGLNLSGDTVKGLNNLLKQHDLFKVITTKKMKKPSERLKKLEELYSKSKSEKDLKILNRASLEEFYSQETPTSQSEIIRYPSAFEPHSGIHGPGRAVRIDRLQEEEDSCGRDPGDLRQHKFAYIGELVEKLPLAAKDTRALFKISEDKKPWSYDCKFGSGINEAEWEIWIKERNLVKDDLDSIFLEPHEIDLINRLGDAISTLSHKEIRALGTHHSAAGTIHAIEFNRSKWFTNCILMCRLPSRETMFRLAGQLIVLADEISRKSHRNRDSYNSGRKKMAKNLGSGQLFYAFNKTQHEADSIWNDVTIMEYSSYSQVFIDLSTYISCLCDFLQGSPNSAQRIDEANSTVPFLNNFLEKKRLRLPLLNSTQIEKEYVQIFKMS
jgi:hypothetical protein